MWAESRWANDAFQLRIFLVQDEVSQVIGSSFVFAICAVWLLDIINLFDAYENKIVIG